MYVDTTNQIEDFCYLNPGESPPCSLTYDQFIDTQLITNLLWENQEMLTEVYKRDSNHRYHGWLLDHPETPAGQEYLRKLRMVI